MKQKIRESVVTLYNKYSEKEYEFGVELYLDREAEYENDMVGLKLRMEKGDEYVEAEDFFNCLKLLRDKLKPEWIFLCNGACLNVYPSGMQRSMNKGIKAYRCTLGKKVGSDDIVDIFGRAELNLISDVKSQEEFYKKFILSL
jgi:hypothetical protein